MIFKNQRAAFAEHMPLTKRGGLTDFEMEKEGRKRKPQVLALMLMYLLSVGASGTEWQ